MYKPAFIHAYKSSKSSLSLPVWAKAVGRRLPQFRNEEDIYSPVPLHIKIAGSLNDSNGAVRLSVQPTNENWYHDLTQALSEMTNERNVEVVNYLGESIRDMSPEQLMAVGECDCVKQTNGLFHPVRLASVVPPPLHMSTNKQAELKEWWNGIRSPLSEKIAEHLKGMTMAEIAKATLVDGPIQNEIETYLVGHTLHNLEWDAFLSTYGSGNTTSDAMSKKLLDAVRQSLVANENQVREHHASIGSEAALWKSNQGSGQSRYKDDFTLYRDIIEDAMYHPLVGQQMIQAIVHGSIGRCMKQKKKKTKKVIASGIHPITAYYQQYHFNEYGKLPGHRIAELNRNIATTGAYPGDAKRAFDMFNLFSGRGIDNTQAVVHSNLIPISEAISHAQRYSSEMPKLIPIDHLCDEMPKLIPIEQSLEPINCGSCGTHKKKKDKKSGKPINMEMPRLIPIEVPSDEQLGEPIWVDDCPNLMDFLRK